VSSLPVIVGFGGVNPAGRSFVSPWLHARGVRRPGNYRSGQGASIARSPDEHRPRHACGARGKQILDHTLIRKIEPGWFDTEKLYQHAKLTAVPQGESLCWTMSERDLPNEIPPHWRVARLDEGRVQITVLESTTLFVPDHQSYSVRAAGLLPTA